MPIGNWTAQGSPHGLPFPLLVNKTPVSRYERPSDSDFLEALKVIIEYIIKQKKKKRKRF